MPQRLLKSVLFVHADAFHDPPPKEYLARVYRAIELFLPKEGNDVDMDTLLFKHFVIYGDKVCLDVVVTVEANGLHGELGAQLRCRAQILRPYCGIIFGLFWVR